MLTTNALSQYVAKLERRGALPQRERDALLGLPGARHTYAGNETIIAAGDPATHCVVVESGFVSRTRHLGDGVRQIVAFHLPGDAVDLQSVLFAKCDHEVRSHNPTSTYWIPHREILALTKEFPIVANALWLDTLVDSSIFREWTANVGQRNARQRIAYLFLELAARFEAIRLVKDDSYDLPVTQTNLAEALGLSLVHFNKSLQAMHKSGLVTFKDRRVVLNDKAALLDFSGFRDDYLHLDERRVKDPVAVDRNTAESHIESVP